MQLGDEWQAKCRPLHPELFLVVVAKEAVAATGARAVGKVVGVVADTKAVVQAAVVMERASEAVAAKAMVQKDEATAA